MQDRKNQRTMLKMTELKSNSSRKNLQLLPQVLARVPPLQIRYRLGMPPSPLQQGPEIEIDLLLHRGRFIGARRGKVLRLQMRM